MYTTWRGKSLPPNVYSYKYDLFRWSSMLDCLSMPILPEESCSTFPILVFFSVRDALRFSLCMTHFHSIFMTWKKNVCIYIYIYCLWRKKRERGKLRVQDWSIESTSRKSRFMIVSPLCRRETLIHHVALVIFLHCLALLGNLCFICKFDKLRCS